MSHPTASDRRAAGALRDTSDGLQSKLESRLLPLIRDAIDAGVGSAMGLGVVTTGGGRAMCIAGATLRFSEEPASPRGGNASSTARAVTASTLFDVASLTKPMVTSTLLAGAVAEGRLSLEQRLDSVLPAAVGAALGDRTLRSLLGHTSGAIAWHDFYAETRKLALDARPDAMLTAVLRHPLSRTAQPPTDDCAVYSDLGFIALGRALEVHFGAPLDVLFARRVAAPLGLQAQFRRISRRASAPLDPPDRAVVATEIWPPRCPDGRPLQGVVHDDNCAGLDGVAGHAGLFASLDDVLTWARAWLQAVAGEQTALGARLPASLARAWVTSTGTGAPGPGSTTWRLGFDTPSSGQSSAGARVSDRAFGHLGFTGTSVWIDPTRGAAVVLLSNRVHPSRAAHAPIKALRPRVYDAVWGLLDT